jgi:hypothetical protein
MNGSLPSMSELKKYLVLFLAFVAFLLAAYIQGGGTWRGHHNLRKSLPAKGATIGLQDAHPPKPATLGLTAESHGGGYERR